MEIFDGKITCIDESGLTIRVPYTNIHRACLRQYAEVQVGLPDGRTISPEQRKKAHAIISEVADYTGYAPEWMKRHMKVEFMATRLQALEKAMFSLSDCDMTTAREFITFLIDFVVEHGIPCRMPLYEMCEDIQRYVWINLMHKKCCICGKPACVHHAEDRVGMGRNRKTIIHEGMSVMPLCWGIGSHHDEVHQIEQAAFNEKYHIHGIPATKEICKKWGLKYECE